MKKLIVPLVLITILPMGAQAESTGYISVDFGQTKGHLQFDGSLSTKDKDTAYSFAGGVKLSENAAVELGYTDYGKISDTREFMGSPYEEVIETSMYSLSMVFGGKVAEKLDGFARLGIAAWDFNYLYSDLGGYFDEDDDGTDVYLGLGLSYSLNEAVDLDLEYQKFEVDPEIYDFYSDLSYSTILLGAKFHF
jgi:OOP family OmpA-OmpF porin